MMSAATPGGLSSALFAPSCIALVGASDDLSKASSRPLTYLRRYGFAGPVFPVNSRRETVAGEKCYASLHDLPAVPDHVLVMTPAGNVIDVIRECGALGVTVATVLSGGFSEAGPAGAAREQELVREAKAAGVRLLGPNSLGLVNLHTGLRVTGNAVFAEPGLLAGGTFVASQSGSMIGSLVSRGLRKGIGFSTAVSVGAEADLGLGEICALTLDDPLVSGYVLFLEAIRHAGALAEFARGAFERGKPVVAYKLGRSQVGGELAISHTGALAGDDAIASVFLAQVGITRVMTLDGLLEAQPLMGKLDPQAVSRAPRVGVLTTTGGGAAMVVDELGVRGIMVQRPTTETFGRLASAGVAVQTGRIVDLTLAGTRPEIMKAALDVLTGADEFELILAVAGSSARLQPELVVAPIIAASKSGHPIAAFLVPDAPEAFRQLSEAGIPVFENPETCADVISAALARRAPSAAARLVPEPTPVQQSVVLDEAQSHPFLARHGIVTVPSVIIDVPSGTPDDLPQDIKLPFGYPIVAKVLDPVLPHKTDAGGVAVNLGDLSDLRRAVSTIADALSGATPRQSLRRLLVQPMINGVGELLVGYRLDPHVGPIVLVAAGGTFTELYRDRSVRLAPVTKGEAAEMLTEVRAVAALRGYRGAVPADLDAVADAIVSISQFASRPGVLEAEINPLIALPEGEGAVAVDALIRLDGTEVTR